LSAQKSMINNLTEGSITRQLLKFAIPLILANILQTLYNTVDMIVVGQFVGADGLSAVSIGGEFIHFFMFMCAGFCGGGQILISQQVGMKDKVGISRTIGTVFTTIMFIAVLFMVICFAIDDIMLRWLNTPEAAFEQASQYVAISGAGLIFIFGYNCVSSVLRGMGDSKRPLMFIAIAATVNLILDLVLVAWLEMGAAGAAIATVVGQAVSVICSTTYLYRHRDAFGFDFKLKSFIPDPDRIKALIKVGTPLAVQQVAISTSLLFVQSYINAFGVAASAVTGIGQKIQNISGIFMNGINQAGGAMIGQCLGAQKQNRAKKVVYIGLCFSAVFAVINISLALTMPTQLFSIFSTDTEVLAMAPRYLQIQCWAFVGSALMGPFGAMVTGSGFSTLGLFVGLLDAVVARVGLSVLLGQVLGMGLEGYFYGSALARLAGASVQMIYFFSGKWKTRKLLVKKMDEE